ncbi:4-alpha-glucanotransferase [bioreactor metagenome]|uniref:4-alpha-glucanotransferase n=1 Tax=bioreactor metagenome TaxID=1076179 RepID=A0A645BT32_9ZZZZ
MLKARESGILLSVFSLPGDFGIGTLGAGARRFVDFLASAGQSYWQTLPLFPGGEGNSPYMSPSSFAGNPLFIDLEELTEHGLLTADELRGARADNPDRVNYESLAEGRLCLLRQAWERSKTSPVLAGCPELEEYAQFEAERNGDNPDFHRFLQEVFCRQWFALKRYANDRGVKLIGDLPFYVSPNSAETRYHPELFQLDPFGHPCRTAGVPPDAFSDSGQLWGNPLYNWEGCGDELFDWWTRRLTWAVRLFDTVRLDHFRGIHTYWSVPAGAKDASEGRWEKGPGMSLIRHLEQTVPGLSVIAEDLGDLDEEALRFVKGSGIPGMRVLVFAFDPSQESAYLPHNCPPDSVMYTGTHDTPTFVQWLFCAASPEEREYACEYLRLSAEEGFGWGAVRGAWASPSRLAIAPLQDVLGLGADARVNTPSTMSPMNWSWRVREDALNGDVASRLRSLTRTYRRLR